MYDVNITSNYGDSYIVSVWKNQWLLVSKHKYESDAEQIKKAITDGLSREDVLDLISKQDNRCNKKLLKYFENWTI